MDSTNPTKPEENTQNPQAPAQPATDGYGSPAGPPPPPVPGGIQPQATDPAPAPQPAPAVTTPPPVADPAAPIAPATPAPETSSAPAPAPTPTESAPTTDPSVSPAPSSPAQPEQPAPAQDASTPAPATPAPDASQAAPAQPATDTMQATVPMPEHPASAPKKGMNLWLMLSLVLLVVVLAGSGYFYMLSKNKTSEVTQMLYPTKAVSPTAPVHVSPSPATTESATGSVSGKLCYPASGIPAGTIFAKDIKTNKEYTQEYKGTAAGASTLYTFSLPDGSYHLKFVPTQYATNVGYYTEYSSCVGNPVGPNCTGQKTRAISTATVSAKMTVQNVNLCDYYYPAATPPQY